MTKKLPDPESRGEDVFAQTFQEYDLVAVVDRVLRTVTLERAAHPGAVYVAQNLPAAALKAAAEFADLVEGLEAGRDRVAAKRGEWTLIARGHARRVSYAEAVRLLTRTDAGGGRGHPSDVRQDLVKAYERQGPIGVYDDDGAEAVLTPPPRVIRVTPELVERLRQAANWLGPPRPPGGFTSAQIGEIALGEPEPCNLRPLTADGVSAVPQPQRTPPAAPPAPHVAGDTP